MDDIIERVTIAAPLGDARLELKKFLDEASGNEGGAPQISLHTVVAHGACRGEHDVLITFVRTFASRPSARETSSRTRCSVTRASSGAGASIFPK